MKSYRSRISTRSRKWLLVPVIGRSVTANTNISATVFWYVRTSSSGKAIRVLINDSKNCSCAVNVSSVYAADSRCATYCNRLAPTEAVKQLRYLNFIAAISRSKWVKNRQAQFKSVNNISSYLRCWLKAGNSNFVFMVTDYRTDVACLKIICARNECNSGARYSARIKRNARAVKPSVWLVDNFVINPSIKAKCWYVEWY